MKDISPEVVTVKAVVFEENVKLFISNQMENLLGGGVLFGRCVFKSTKR